MKYFKLYNSKYPIDYNSEFSNFVDKIIDNFFKHGFYIFRNKLFKEQSYDEFFAYKQARQPIHESLDQLIDFNRQFCFISPALHEKIQEKLIQDDLDIKFEIFYYLNNSPENFQNFCQKNQINYSDYHAEFMPLYQCINKDKLEMPQEHKLQFFNDTLDILIEYSTLFSQNRYLLNFIQLFSLEPSENNYEYFNKLVDFIFQQNKDIQRTLISKMNNQYYHNPKYIFKVLDVLDENNKLKFLILISEKIPDSPDLTKIFKQNLLDPVRKQQLLSLDKSKKFKTLVDITLNNVNTKLKPVLTKEFSVMFSVKKSDIKNKFNGNILAGALWFFHSLKTSIPDDFIFIEQQGIYFIILNTEKYIPNSEFQNYISSNLPKWGKEAFSNYSQNLAYPSYQKILDFHKLLREKELLSLIETTSKETKVKKKI